MHRMYSYVGDLLSDVEFIKRGIIKKIREKIYLFLSWLITFNFVTFAWIFFRSSTLSDALVLIKQLFSFSGNIDNIRYLYFTLIALFFFLLGSKFRDLCTEVQKRLPYALQIVLACIIIIAIIHFSSDVVPPFIYFSF